ncbi:MAG: type VI secretion system protein TssA, partial [Ferrovibrionaceae bacterium]
MSIDRDSLLQPIKPDAPSGPSLHYEPLYDQIKEARREDDAIAPQGIWQTTLKTANWRKVADLCSDGLKKSKDIQLVAWLTEALVQTDGYDGLATGLDLLNGLSQGFWETLWPEPDDVESGDYESRVIVYEWLQRQLMRRLPFVALTDPSSRTEDPYDL